VAIGWPISASTGKVVPTCFDPWWPNRKTERTAAWFGLAAPHAPRLFMMRLPQYLTAIDPSGSGAMTQYRVYELGKDDHIETPATVIEHADDEAAIAHARQLLDGHDIELWDGPRLVIRLTSKHKK
jgi:hypothetical protein